MEYSYTYGKYRIDYVFGRMTDDQKRRVIDFWRRNGAVASSHEGMKRLPEVVLMAVDENDQVVGVTTAYIDVAPRDGNRYFFYRVFIQPGNRETLMSAFLTVKTYEHLTEFEMVDKPEGLVLVTENRKLMRKAARRGIERLGFDSCGQDDLGRDIWVGKW